MPEALQRLEGLIDTHLAMDRQNEVSFGMEAHVEFLQAPGG